jgi:serine/threonine protein kinase
VGLTVSHSPKLTFFTEVQIMRQINHPSVVKLISFSESDEYYFLVLERESIFHAYVHIVRLFLSIGGWGVISPNVRNYFFFHSSFT